MNINTVNDLRKAYPELMAKVDEEAELRAIEAMINRAKYETFETRDQLIVSLEEKKAAIDVAKYMNRGR